jgi:NTP pyrophosphatase (non-canonical NTP hydrolase)
MKDEFNGFIDLVEKNFEYCPWTKTRTLDQWKDALVEEVKEVGKAIETSDYKNLKEELGDLLWDTITIAVFAEKRGHFNSADVLKELKEKINRRKPYLQTGEEVTTEKALDIWKKVKETEKLKEVIK